MLVQDLRDHLELVFEVLNLLLELLVLVLFVLARALGRDLVANLLLLLASELLVAFKLGLQFVNFLLRLKEVLVRICEFTAAFLARWLIASS